MSEFRVIAIDHMDSGMRFVLTEFGNDEAREVARFYYADEAQEYAEFLAAQQDPFKDPEWLSYADHVRKELIPKIQGSAVTMSMVTGHEPDPKMAMETGYMILLDKPIITVVTPGVMVPAKLALVSDAIVEADLDNPAQAAQAVRAAISRLGLT